jgi:N-acetylneuraminate synthase
MSILNIFKSINSNSGPSKPYIIAEAGVNHEGSLDLAKRLIDEAAQGGADAIKFQTYKADSIASKDSPYYWDITKEPTRSQYKLFQKYDKFWKKDYENLAKYCELVDIEFMSTPFDIKSAKFLNDLMPVFKISSSDITNLPFIEFMCDFGKPIILSTGASYLWEIQEAVDLIENKGNKLCLMHCVLNYPTPNEYANLAMIRDIAKKFPNAITGYSDHTLPEDMDTCLYAYLLGARVIEKHFTHDKSLPGNDHYHAMDKEDLNNFLKKIEYAKVLLGKEKITSIPSEDAARKNARRSLVASCDIAVGTELSHNHLTWKRPASGISPKEIDNVIGRKVLHEIKEDDILKWNHIDL